MSRRAKPATDEQPRGECLAGALLRPLDLVISPVPPRRGLQLQRGAIGLAAALARNYL